MQGYTYNGVGETITLNLDLDATFSGDSGASAQVGVFFTNNLTFRTGQTGFATLAFEEASDSLMASTQLLASESFNNLTADNLTLSFDVLPGTEFLVWAGLQVDAKFGGVADADNTFTMSFNEEAKGSLTATAMPDIGAVPLPAGIWLFLTGIVAFVGLSRRRTSGA